MSYPILRSLTAVALLCLSIVPSAGSAPSGGQPAAWTPELMMKVRPVVTVRPSPDGRRVAYVVTDAVMAADKSEYVSQIYVASADTSPRA